MIRWLMAGVLAIGLSVSLVWSNGWAWAQDLSIATPVGSDAIVPLVGPSPTPNGAKIFANSCSTCHIGGSNVLVAQKNLAQETLEKFAMDSIEAIQHQVMHGKNAMPAFGKKLSPEEIQAVAGYVLQQAQAGW